MGGTGGRLRSGENGEAEVFIPLFLCLGRFICCRTSPAPADSSPAEEAGKALGSAMWSYLLGLSDPAPEWLWLPALPFAVQLSCSPLLG